MKLRHPTLDRVVRILGASSFVLTVSGAAGCSAANGGTTGQSGSALATAASADGGAAAISACLTSYVECVRSDAGSCRRALHDCMGHGGGGGDCDGDGGGARPPRPDDGDDDDADGGAPPPGGPGTCLATLDQCAAGTDTVDVCVSTGETCLAALPPPAEGGKRDHR